jgi:hypothetical protein
LFDLIASQTDDVRGSARRTDDGLRDPQSRHAYLAIYLIVVGVVGLTGIASRFPS